MNTNRHTDQQDLCFKEMPPTPVNKAISALIVDDSPLIAEKIMELLEEVPVVTSFKSCSTYSEAVAILPVFNPAVVLLDINLPDKSGIILLKHIKAFHPDIVVFMVTNQSSHFYKDLCIEIGAHYFLDKSHDFEQLPALIAAILN